ncbi:uncharacterized protein CC84DRAFT_1239629 [Paraphaeosphaeria sporulosa]|uniref:Uncharacterized protein n=1 Tax=Paraphaeosphaeria sporulosa TaxID=1460663 RepID=A0A177CLL9_9PLEO|nr:uncharacterized protein CC84DRAFT_1239629 [Paraphaeosphaeria sporulosa]OAG08444.1 hypothetical protein CC84DRAFT_1239629 [Paraphaeosphaeria sporulosa]
MYRSAPISFDTRSRSAARSHAARVGWQRSSKAAKIQERQRMLKDFLPESAWEPRWNNQEAVNRQPNQTSTQRNINAGSINDAIRVIDVSLAYGKIFPSHGAISLPMLDETTDSTAFHVAQFLGTFIWPTVGGHIAAYQWFQDFCTSRVLFHSQSAASATYRDLMAGKPSISMTRRNFQHKLEAIREIRSSLTRWHMVSKPEREQVIFAILILASHEVKEKDFLETTSPFSA